MRRFISWAFDSMNPGRAWCFTVGACVLIGAATALSAKLVTPWAFIGIPVAALAIAILMVRQ